MNFLICHYSLLMRSEMVKIQLYLIYACLRPLKREEQPQKGVFVLSPNAIEIE